MDSTVRSRRIAVTLEALLALSSTAATAVAAITYPAQPMLGIAVGVAAASWIGAVLILRRCCRRILAMAACDAPTRVLSGISFTSLGITAMIGGAGCGVMILRSGPPRAAALVFGLVAAGGAAIAVGGLALTAGRLTARRTFGLLRPLLTDRPPSFFGRLTVAGWLALLLTVTVTLVGGVILTAWLYQGVRPSGWPNTLLALPALALAFGTWLACALSCRLIGVRMLRSEPVAD